MTGLAWGGWVLAGAVLGIAMGVCTRAQLIGHHPRTWLTAPQILAPTTAVLFGLLAWRIPFGTTLVLDSVLAAVAAPLAAVDILELRLPVRLVWPTYLCAASVVIAAGILHDRQSAGRAALAMLVMVTCYGLIALTSRGGLGAGDVRLAGLIGLIVGWTGWPVLVAATVLGFVLGGLAGVIVLIRSWPQCGVAIPFGPAILAGALMAMFVFALPATDQAVPPGVTVDTVLHPTPSWSIPLGAACQHHAIRTADVDTAFCS